MGSTLCNATFTGNVTVGNTCTASSFWGNGANVTGLNWATTGGRLTLTSGVAVTTSDVIGASTLYYAQHLSDAVMVYTSGQWTQTRSLESPLALSGMTAGKNYDVFCGPGLVLELSTAWTNDTTRATALAVQDGTLVRSDQPTKRYVGTIRATCATTTEDSQARRFVWNAYNRIPRTLLAENATSHTYATPTWRAWNGGMGTPRVEWVQGLAEAPVQAGVVGDTSTANGVASYMGVSLNGATPANRLCFGTTQAGRMSVWGAADAGLGYGKAEAWEFAGGATATYTYASLSGTTLG